MPHVVGWRSSARIKPALILPLFHHLLPHHLLAVVALADSRSFLHGYFLLQRVDPDLYLPTMMRTLLARPPSAAASGPLNVPSIVVTLPDEPTPTTPRFFMYRAHPAAIDNGLLQVPRKVSGRQQHQQQQQQQQLQQQRPQHTTHVTTPLIKFDRPPPRLARHRPQPIPLPEPVDIPVTVVQETPAHHQHVQQQHSNETTNTNAITIPPSPTVRSVFDTLKGLEKYCESLVVSAKARPTDHLVAPAAPKPVACTGAFKKSHRRVHSVDISWNRAPPSGGRLGVATTLTQRRKRSISNADEIFIGAPKAIATLARSERSMALSRRLAGQSRTTCAVLPDLIEDVHQTAPVARTRVQTHTQPARGLPKTRSMSVDERLANLLRPQPTVLSNRSGRANLASLYGAVAATGSTQHANNANLGMLPEGLDLMPAATLAVGYYASLSKNAASLGQKVRRYITV